jgi:hypothetical protein
MSRNSKVTRPGAVKKIIKPPTPKEPEKAEIQVLGADHLYREIRIENKLEDDAGKKVKLKEGAMVSVTIEAEPEETLPRGN